MARTMKATEHAAFTVTVPVVLSEETSWRSPHSMKACIEVHPLSGVALKTSSNSQKAPKERTHHSQYLN